MPALKLTEADVQNCTWSLVETTPEYRRYVGHGTHPVTGVDITVQKTEFLGEDQLIAANATARNETDNTRWTQGAGSDKIGVPMVLVARTPLNKFISDFQKHTADGDRDFTKWYFERDENQPFRTRNGKL